MAGKNENSIFYLIFFFQEFLGVNLFRPQQELKKPRYNTLQFLKKPFCCKPFVLYSLQNCGFYLFF